MSKSKIKIPVKVVKRDGNVVDFDEAKIAAAIFGAAKAVGGQDFRMARELAAQVTRSLTAVHQGSRLHIEDIQDAVEKILIKAGHARTAKEYILYREKRAELRYQLMVREGSTNDNGCVYVDMRSSEKLLPWDKARISTALVREHQLPADKALAVAGAVESKIFSSGITRISTGLIRELVDNELFERGMAGLLKNTGMITLPTYNLEQRLRGGVEADEGHPSDFSETVSRGVLRQYALQNIYSADITEAHGKGDIHLHYLGDIHRVIRRRHCGPIHSDCPEKALADLAFTCGRMQPFFACFPHFDYFNVLFAPLARALDASALRAAIREFLHLLKQLVLSGTARECLQFDIYGYVPETLASLGINEAFPPLIAGGEGGVYNDYYREMHTFAKVLLEEAEAIPDAHDLFRFTLHLSECFKADESENLLMEQFFAFGRERGEVTFVFGDAGGAVDRRMEFLQGGDTEFHRVSINCARLFFDVPLKTEEAVIEDFKSVCASALYSGIEKLDFIASLMRRPGQILWEYGRQGRQDYGYDVLSSYMSLVFTGVYEGLCFADWADFDGEELLSEFLQIAVDIIDSKGEEYPFSVRILPGETGSASFRFADADRERYPEKQDFLAVNREGRLHYEGFPVFYGDDPVPIAAEAASHTQHFRYFPGAGRVILYPGSQVDRASSFITLADRVMEAVGLHAFIIKPEK